MSKQFYKFATLLTITFLLIFNVIINASAQEKSVLWESVDVSQRNLYYGPGGKEMMPDLSKITFIEEEKNGHNKKYRIKDGKGNVWVAKLGREAQPETAAVRITWALGYKSEINYLIPKLTIPGKGTFKNVRLEARPANIERMDEWKWEENPFVGTNELQGLKIMMVFLKNWDVLDLQNKVLKVQTENGTEFHYIISDLGATFGKLGNNNLPIFFRLGRSTGNPDAYVKSDLIRDVDNEKLELSYKGKSRGIFQDITVGNARWLYGLLSQLSDQQIRDAFRAANYSQSDIETFTKGVKDKIQELADLVNNKESAKK